MDVYKEFLDAFPTTVVTVGVTMSTIFLYGIMKNLERIGLLMIMLGDKEGVEKLFKEYMKNRK